MAFDGTAEYSLDAKNRLTVPARFSADFGAGLVLAKGIERCVALWKPADYESFRAAALEGMHPLSQDARKLQLYYDGRRLRLVAWKTRRAVYWVSNTLSQSLNNRQMLAIAESLTRLKQ